MTAESDPPTPAELEPAELEPAELEPAELVDFDDVAARVEAILHARLRERNPRHPTGVGPPGELARLIAELAGGDLGIAEVVARNHDLDDRMTVVDHRIRSVESDQAVLAAFIDPLNGIEDTTALALLGTLAHAEPPGFTLDLWRIAVQALHGREIPARRLERFVAGHAGDLLFGTTGDGGTATYQLTNRVIIDALLADRGRTTNDFGVEDQRALTGAFTDHGGRLGWHRAPDYLWRSLPRHALWASMIGTLLADTDYLIRADLRILTPSGHERAELLYFTPQAETADPAERLALLSVTEALITPQSTGLRHHPMTTPYRAVWAISSAPWPSRTFAGHPGTVTALCAVAVDGRDRLASAGDDGTVRIWDPTTGACLNSWDRFDGNATGVCAVRVDGRDLLAVSTGGAKVIVLDPATGVAVRVLDAGNRSETRHIRQVHGVCAVRVDGRDLLASTCGDDTLCLWDPVTGRRLLKLDGHPVAGGAHGLCAVRVDDGRELLAFADRDGPARLIDPLTGAVVRTLALWVSVLGTVRVDGRELLAGRTPYGVRIWDPATGADEGVLPTVTAIGAVRFEERQLLATAGYDGPVSLWDRTRKGHSSCVTMMCTLEVDGRNLLAAAFADGTVRIWESHSGTELGTIDGLGPITGLNTVTVESRSLLAVTGREGSLWIWDPTSGDRERLLLDLGAVTGLHSIRAGRRELLAIAIDEDVRLWDPASRSDVRTLPGTGSVQCPVRLHGRDRLATADTNGTLRLWNPDSGTVRLIARVIGSVTAMRTVRGAGRDLLATAGTDGSVRLIDPATGTTGHIFTAHGGPVLGMSTVRSGHRNLLAIIGTDRIIRLWDPVTGRQTHHIPIQREPRALADAGGGHLAVGTVANVIMLRLGPGR